MDSGYPQTLPDVFARAFRKFADRTALADGVESVTFGDLDDRSARFATALADRGVDVGDRVGVLLPNEVLFPTVDLGVIRAGATRLPVNPEHTATELTYLLEDSEARTLVCGPAQLDAVVEAARSVAALETVVVAGDEEVASFPDADVEWHRYGEFLADVPDLTTVPTPGPDDVAGHFYTGGTTSRPKGVHYSQQCLVENLQAVVTEFGFSGTDVGLLVPPLSHSAGTFCYAALLAGGTVHLRTGFDAGSLLETVDDERVTWTFLVPTMIYRLLDATPDGLDHPSLERIIYGAAPMRVDRLREAIERFGPVFHQFYGQTEVPNLITSFPPREHEVAFAAGDDDRLASAGTPCLRATVEIRDEETDDALPPGEVGEVVVAAPYVFDGYHERPAETRETLRDGWVYTGDVGVVDEDGYLTLLDRASDVIVTGGMNVYSQAVEQVLRDHPAVDDAAVVGVPHEEWGEAVHAVVVTNDAVTIEELRSSAGERLASYKKPKSMTVVDSLPTTTLGKVDRSAVRERFWDDGDRSI
ncbi:AMP-binding protein [Halobacteria archaeon HArc-gm2]|nr:AMP-binding protein [Halobacteria archaeon HArc-gm2]